MELEKVKPSHVPTVAPKYPQWPTSRPGPQVTEPPPGYRPVPVRSDQVIELAAGVTWSETGIRFMEQMGLTPVGQNNQEEPPKEKGWLRLRKSRPDLPR
uniref:Uncharacterized protein n=1 Tax=Thermogemmatispora argillosa TaxID=2045280 RepID=A0A455T268_9CHLR|nr:hypothetical protein KTA_21970 [Thermogemmatispora argillosa]